MEIDFPSVAQLLAAVPVLGLLIALGNVWLSARAERRRSQPVVVVHKRGHLLAGKVDGYWVVGCVVRNEGGGAAFNVTFGGEIKGVRFPSSIERGDPRPSRIRVIASGAKLPEPDAVRGSLPGMQLQFSISVPSLDRLALGRVSEEDEVYWARYENGHGHTWETRNSGGDAGELEIRRVWRHGVREWRHRRARTRLNRRRTEIEQMPVRNPEPGVDRPPAAHVPRSCPGRPQALVAQASKSPPTGPRGR